MVRMTVVRMATSLVVKTVVWWVAPSVAWTAIQKGRQRAVLLGYWSADSMAVQSVFALVDKMETARDSKMAGRLEDPMEDPMGTSKVDWMACLKDAHSGLCTDDWWAYALV